MLEQQRATVPARLFVAMHYCLLGPGKRVRPSLCLLAAEAQGAAKRAALEVPPQQARSAALPAAMAVECVHAYSLVHDDLPCMDDDSLRRGRPTVHVAYDQATAVLVGDALQTLAFQILATQESSVLVQPQVALLAQASGAAGMVGGQALDMAAEGQTPSLESVLALHRSKTGALIQASFALGATAAGASTAQIAAWENFGDGIGVLFQATDDLLDATATTEILGKTAGKDAAVAKATLAAVLGLTGLRSMIEQEVERSLTAFDALKLLPGPASNALQALPDFLAHRAH